MRKGRVALQKRMKLWKSSKRPLAPPPSSLVNHIADFETKLRQKCVCSLWQDCCVLYDLISHEMHVVQQFNMVLGWIREAPLKLLTKAFGHCHFNGASLIRFGRGRLPLGFVGSYIAVQCWRYTQTQQGPSVCWLLGAAAVVCKTSMVLFSYSICSWRLLEILEVILVKFDKYGQHGQITSCMRPRRSKVISVKSADAEWVSERRPVTIIKRCPNIQ